MNVSTYKYGAFSFVYSWHGHSLARIKLLYIYDIYPEASRRCCFWANRRLAAVPWRVLWWRAGSRIYLLENLASLRALNVAADGRTRDLDWMHSCCCFECCSKCSNDHHRSPLTVWNNKGLLLEDKIWKKKYLFRLWNQLVL